MDDKLFPQPPGEASFVAIGDSFTEGLNDVASGGGYRGWADRLAGLLAAEHPGLRYANLAIRGKLLRQIVAEQVPAAAAMSPGLVSIAGGGNDILRPGADPDVLAELFDSAIARLRAAGCQVLMFTGFDPVGFPVLRLLRGRISTYNMHLRGIADARGCYLVDLWSMRFLRSPGAWSQDRLHLNAQSHQRVALRACEVLGIPVTEDWRAPLAGDPAQAPLPADTVPAYTGPASIVPFSAGPAYTGRASTGAASTGRASTGAASTGRASTGPASTGPASTGPASTGPFSAGPFLAVPASTRDAMTRDAWLVARREDARWAKEYLAPWVARRLHGTSSGDGRSAKRPALEPVSPPMLM